MIVFALTTIPSFWATSMWARSTAWNCGNRPCSVLIFTVANDECSIPGEETKMDLKEIVGPLGQAVTINERNHGMVESFCPGEDRMLSSG